MTSNFIFIFIICTFQLSIISCNVLELGEEFLDLEKEGKWLVMFYAPWCGHCRSLEPTWVEVGSSFQEIKSDVNVAKLDASRYTSVASHFGIRGFPTIKFFNDGYQYDYSGARNKHSIVSFVNRAKGPSITDLSDSKSFEQVKEKYDVFFLYVGKTEGDLYDMYLPITKQLFTTISFFNAPRDILPKNVISGTESTIAVYKDKKFYQLPDGLPDAEFLKMWILAEQFASYNELSGMTYHLLRASNRRFAVAVLRRDDPFNKTFEAMAFDRGHPYMFCWVEGNGIANRLTSREVSVPNLIVYDANSFEYFLMFNENDTHTLTKEKVEEFFQKIDDGVISPQGGSGIIQKIQRSMMDVMIYFYELFSKKPLVASVIVIVPIVLFTALCACLCSMSSEKVYTVDEEVEEDEKAEEEENEEDQKPEEDEGAAGDYDNSEEDKSTNLRKRIKEPKEDE